MFDLLVSPFFDSQGGQIKVRFGGTLRVRPTVIRKKRNYFCSQVEVKQRTLPGNVLNRDFQAQRPGEKLVSDVTYLPDHGVTFRWLRICVQGKLWPVRRPNRRTWTWR